MHISSWVSGLSLYFSGTLKEKITPLNGTRSDLQLKVWHISVLSWDDRNEECAYFRATKMAETDEMNCFLRRKLGRVGPSFVNCPRFYTCHFTARACLYIHNIKCGIFLKTE